MHVEQYVHSEAGWSRPLSAQASSGGRGFVLAFGAREAIEAGTALADVARARGDMPLLVASTSGEIAGMEVSDGKLVVTVVRLDSVRVAARCVPIGPNDFSQAVGRSLASLLPATVEGAALRHVMVLSDGLAVNGTALVDGMSSALPAGCAITGGLAGDAGRFERTLVGLDGNVSSGQVVALGFYGDALQVGYGSLGGWDAFGPERRADQSDGNILRALDGEVALEVYKRYLGEHAAGLPGSALRFPLAVTAPGADRAVVRTILAVDEASGAMTFAGDIPVGSRVRLMKANHERLVEGAEEAGRLAMRPGARLAVLISCVGRKLVMGQRTEEEVEGVAAALGAGAVVAGFYSYGELCPVDAMSACELHNQTMTVTTFGEAG